MPLVNQGLQTALLVQNVSNNHLEGATCLTASIHFGNNFRFIAMQHPTSLVEHILLVDTG